MNPDLKAGGRGGGSNGGGGLSNLDPSVRICPLFQGRKKYTPPPWKPSFFLFPGLRPRGVYPRATFKRGVTERGVFAFACQCIVSPRGRTGNRTVTQMRHPLLVEGRPNCARQSLASTLSAPHVAETSCCDPGRHANVITPCLLTPCLNVPYVTLLSGPMVYTLCPCFPRKMVYTIIYFCSAASGSGDRPRKEGCHGGGVYSFSPCSFWCFPFLYFFGIFPMFSGIFPICPFPLSVHIKAPTRNIV